MRKIENLLRAAKIRTKWPYMVLPAYREMTNDEIYREYIEAFNKGKELRDELSLSSDRFKAIEDAVHKRLSEDIEMAPEVEEFKAQLPQLKKGLALEREIQELTTLAEKHRIHR